MKNGVFWDATACVFFEVGTDISRMQYEDGYLSSQTRLGSHQPQETSPIGKNIRRVRAAVTLQPP
jgi:hypothetical protein